MYGETELDCCGCNAVKCKPCPEVDPKHQVCPTNTGARPLDCYTYKAHHHYAADPHNCWRPNCDENETDAPTDEVDICFPFLMTLFKSPPFLQLPALDCFPDDMYNDN